MKQQLKAVIEALKAYEEWAKAYVIPCQDCQDADCGECGSCDCVYSEVARGAKEAMVT